MARLSSNGAELHRYFSMRNHALMSVRSNGVTLMRRPGGTWKVALRKKPEATLESWMQGKADLVARLPAWQREVKELPSMETLERWHDDGICETPTGERVEPDGTGTDGVPSWLRVLGLI